MGSVFAANPRSAMLIMMASSVRMEANGRVNPSAYLRPIAQPTTNNPAIASKPSQIACRVHRSIPPGLQLGTHPLEIVTERITQFRMLQTVLYSRLQITKFAAAIVAYAFKLAGVGALLA